MITRALIILGALLSLWKVGAAISEKEVLREDGRRVLLELAPVDPRSLMQGDYMILNYALNRQLREKKEADTLPRRGVLVLKINGDDVGAFERWDSWDELAEDECRLRYRRKSQGGRWQSLFTAPESFLFEEGMGEAYEAAKFAELRVDENGVCLLVDLLDESRKVIR